MEKVAIFAFNPEMMCFVHALLNVLDLQEKGCEAALVVEGQSTALLAKMAQPHNPMHDLYRQCKDAGLIKGVCRACAAKMKVLGVIENEGLPISGEMKGHAPVSDFITRGYRVIAI